MLARSIAAPLLACLLASHAFSQEVRLYRQTEAVDPHDVARILGQPPVTAMRPMKMRSIKLLDADAPAAAAGSAAAPQTAAAPARPSTALALPVQFAFDSAEILPAARGQLDALAEGIRLLPVTQAVVIQGHTDAVGSEPYNDALSTRRAYSVKRYLVAVQGIDPGRLRAVGLGEYEPLPGRDLHAAENRRVQFRGE